jgi:hypothetical protein
MTQAAEFNILYEQYAAITRIPQTSPLSLSDENRLQKIRKKYCNDQPESEDNSSTTNKNIFTLEP